MNAKAGKSERRGFGTGAHERAQREQAAVGAELVHLPQRLIDDPDVDRHVVQPAHREQLNLEIGFVALPDRLIGPVADIAILIVAELVERFGQLDRRFAELCFGKGLGLRLDGIERERRRRRLFRCFGCLTRDSGGGAPLADECQSGSERKPLAHHHAAIE